MVLELPYHIHFEERCGRLLLASRDISAGEILFHDVPGAVGPDNNPKPVCLNCYKRLPFLVYRCRHCSWPLCSSFCQQDDGPHARECQLFQIHSPRYQAVCQKSNLVPWSVSFLPDVTFIPKLLNENFNVFIWSLKCGYFPPPLPSCTFTLLHLSFPPILLSLKPALPPCQLVCFVSEL